jgi:hypothetical protein
MTEQQTYRWDAQPGPIGPGWFTMVARYTAPLAGLPGGGGAGGLAFVRGVYGPREPARKRKRAPQAPDYRRQDAETLALLLLTEHDQ